MAVSTTTASAPLAWRFVPAAEVVVLDRWDADFTLHRIAAGAAWRSLEQLGALVSEGERSDRVEVLSTLYRPSNLDRCTLSPGSEHLRSPSTRSPRAVGPGDVVVGKFLPPRVAVITEATPRHAPDGNCVRLVGLTADQALWVASVLNHPTFADTLSHLASGCALPRLGARDLANLPFPPVPSSLEGTANMWAAAADSRFGTLREFHELQAEAQALADDAPPPPEPRTPTWVPVADMPDSWVPDQAALLHYQHELAARGWVPLRHFLVDEPARLRDPIPPSRLLLLSDAKGDLSFALPELAPVKPPWFRIYADPLRPDEILLSTLGSSPKVALNHPVVPSTVWLSDQWARLDGGAVPGALALLLGTTQVTWQLARAATGAVRQFIGRGELVDIRLPALTNTIIESLHRRLFAILERRMEAEARLDSLRLELAGLVTSALEAPR